MLLVLVKQNKEKHQMNGVNEEPHNKELLSNIYSPKL